MKKIIKPISILVLLVVGCLLLINPTLKSIPYGIDLQGGFEILYNIEPLNKDDKLEIIASMHEFLEKYKKYSKSNINFIK